MVYTLVILKLLDRFTSSCCSHLTCWRHKAPNSAFLASKVSSRFREGQVSLSKLSLQLLLVTQTPKWRLTRSLVPLWAGTGTCLGGFQWAEWAGHPARQTGVGPGAAKRDYLPKEFPSFLSSSHLKPLILLTQSTWGRVWSDWRKIEHKPTKPNQTNSPQMYKTKPTKQKICG